MMWLALLLILSGGEAGTRTNKVQVRVTCTAPTPKAFIVLKGVDTPYELTKKETRFEPDLPVSVVVFAETPAVLHLRGRRTGCQKPVITTDDIAQYTFDCGKKSRDLIIVPDPDDVSARYERRVKGEPPDCTVRGSLSGETTIEDVIANEDVVLQFGSAKANAPGLNPHLIRWPKQPSAPLLLRNPGNPEEEPSALTVEAGTLDKSQIEAELARQRAATTGYLSSIEIDVYGKALEHFTRLRFQLRDPPK